MRERNASREVQVIQRRAVLIGSLLGTHAAPAAAAEVRQALARLEARHGGRLGVAMLDTGDGRMAQHRGDERFPLCSTFKLLAAALVLARADAGAESLDRRIRFGREVLLAHSPLTTPRAGTGGMTLDELCAAAVTQSDNAAANLLLDSFGGPAGLTAFLRRIGDPVTRLDRREPELNTAVAGDPRDTTSPLAMVKTVRTLLFGDVLSARSRGRLTAWMEASDTGTDRIRAGLPAGWRAGDKTGTGEHNAVNDVAVFWPPGRPPRLAAVYYIGAQAPLEARKAVLAEVGRLAAAF